MQRINNHSVNSYKISVYYNKQGYVYTVIHCNNVPFLYNRGWPSCYPEVNKWPRIIFRFQVSKVGDCNRRSILWERRRADEHLRRKTVYVETSKTITNTQATYLWNDLKSCDFHSMWTEGPFLVDETTLREAIWVKIYNNSCKTVERETASYMFTVTS